MKEQTTKQRLQALLQEIEAAEKIINTDLSGWDPRTVGGMIIRKRDAEDNLAQLKNTYLTLVAGSIAKVFVSGPNAEEFASYSAEKGAVVLNGAGLYTDFAFQLEPSLDHRTQTFGLGQMELLLNLLQRYMETHRIHMLQMPKLDATEIDSPQTTFEQLVATTRNAIRKSNGDDLLVHDLQNKTLEQTLEKRASSKVVPVIIYGLTSDEQQSLSQKLFGSQPSIFIIADNESKNEELVEQVNNQIRSVFKKQ